MLKQSTGIIPGLFSSLLLSFISISGISQYAPVSTIANGSTYASTVTVPISVSNFVNIANCILEIHYDPAVANVTSATSLPILGGSLFPNFSTPGMLTLSWFTFPGVTLPDNTVIFNIVFSKVSTGTTAVTWYDDGLSCLWNDANYVDLIDVPTSDYYINGSVAFLSLNAPHSILPDIDACNGGLVDVPVKVTAFSNIGKLNLTLQYNSGVVGLQSWTNVSGFPGLSVTSSGSGTLLISGIVPPGNTGVFLSDSAVLVNLQFYHPGGSTGLSWIDGGSSCEYSGPPPLYQVLNDIPQSEYYINGYITGIASPSIVVQPSSPAAVMAGTGSASFMVIATGSQINFQWQEFIASWNDLLNGGFYSGVHSPTLTILNPPLAMNGYRYRCVVNGFCMPGAVTDGTATLTVTPVIGVNELYPEATGFIIFPNPVTPKSVVSGQVPAGACITLTITDVLGHQVFSKTEKGINAGTYEMPFPAGITWKGIYYVGILVRHNGHASGYRKKIVCP